MAVEGFVFGKNLTDDTPLLIPNYRLATQRGFALGQAGAGKTSAAQTYAENLLRMGITCVFFDIVGIWGPGLSLKADGKTPSEFSLAVFGGEHGFMELRPDMGEAIARMIISERFSTVLDLTYLDDREQMQMVANVTHWLGKLNQKARRLTVLFFEEANRFLPQIPVRYAEEAAYEVKRLSDLGRNWGFGFIGISPVPQDLDKRILGQASWTLWMRMVEPLAINEAAKRISTFPDRDLAKMLIEKIPGFEAGRGVFVSPSWMKLLAEVQINKPKTFHFDPEAQGTFDESAFSKSVNQEKLLALFKKFRAVGTKAAEKVEPQVATRGPVESYEHGTRVMAALQATVTELRQNLEAKETEYAQREREAVQSALAQKEGEFTKLQEALRSAFYALQSVVPADNGSQQGLNLAIIPRVARIAQKVAENAKMSKVERAVFQVLVELYAQYPNGVTRERLSAETNYNPKTLSVAIPKLARRGLIVSKTQLVFINPKLLE